MASANKGIAAAALCAAIIAPWLARAADSAAHFRLSAWPSGAPSPNFQLVDVDGSPRTVADYRGRVTVILFGFVRCPDACPTELFKLALALKQMGASSDRVRVLFVTLDPDHDTPGILKQFVKSFDPRFAGLTGTHAQVDEAAAHFFVQYAHVSIGHADTVDHSTGIFILDSRGRLRLLGTLESSVNDLVHDLNALAAS